LPPAGLTVRPSSTSGSLALISRSAPTLSIAGRLPTQVYGAGGLRKIDRQTHSAGAS
jgi:hypothetical protein